MEYNLVITQGFENDLDNVLAYISQNLHNPAAADRLLKNAEEKVKIIRENPFIYPLYHDEAIADKGCRYAVVSNYLLFYTINETNKTIIISRFIYGGQNIINIL